jgi:hypothetical protein
MPYCEAMPRKIQDVVEESEEEGAGLLREEKERVVLPKREGGRQTGY